MKNRIFDRAASAGLLSFMLCLATRGATVVNLNDDGAGSLRYAISNAASGETITFGLGAVGTIVLTSGELLISNKSVTIVGPGAKTLAIDGNLQGRIFNVDATASASLSGLTVTRGYVMGIDSTDYSPNPDADAKGGAILNGGVLKLDACRLTANYARGGNATLSQGGGGTGGAIYNVGVLSLSACTLDDNYAYGGESDSGAAGKNVGFAFGGGEGLGGAICNFGSMALTNCTLAFNIAYGGDARGAPGDGGGASGGALASEGPSAIVNCSIRLNTVLAGSAEDPLIGGEPSGGGVLAHAPCTVFNTILCDNAAGYGARGSLQIGPAPHPDIFGVFVSIGHNLIGSASAPTWPWAPDDLAVAPWGVKAGPLGDYGGETPTMPISRSSPAHDAGDDDVFFGVPDLTSDQRGYSRLRDKHVDIGAYEFDWLRPWFSTNQSIWNSGGGGRWDFLSNWREGFPNASASVLITNPNSKTLTIDSFTSSGAMSVSNLLVSAPTGSVNTLLLDNLGLANPLRIHDNFFLAGGGALTVSNSAIEMNSGRVPTNGTYNGSSVILDGPVFFDRASLTSTGAFDTAIGNVVPGALTMNHGNFRAYDLIVGCGSDGTLSLLNSTGMLNHALSVATSRSGSGRVSILNSRFVATNAMNSNDFLLVLDRGDAQMTVSNSTVQFGDTILGNFGQGSLTLQSGAMTLGKTFLGMNASPFATNSSLPPASGSLIVAGGLVSMSELHVGAQGTGTVNVTGGVLSNSLVSIAESPGSAGNLTITGGTNFIGSQLNVASATDSSGNVRVEGGALNVTNGTATIGSLGQGLMLINNGTVRLKELLLGGPDVAAVPLSPFPERLINVNGTLFYVNRGSVPDRRGTALYKNDVLVKDIGPGSRFRDPQIADIVNVNGTLFFVVDSYFDSGVELWMSDGTEGGTTPVRYIRPGQFPLSSRPAYQPPYQLVDVNGTLYFWAYDGQYGFALWKSDGTELGTVMVKDIVPDLAPGLSGWALGKPVSVNGTLFFVTYDRAHGFELWKSDGTAGGTGVVKDIKPGSGSSMSLTDPLINVDGILFFLADDGMHGSELWKSDGTELGTRMVKDIVPGLSGSFTRDLVNVNGTLFFASGSDLWRSDGTELGTRVVKTILGLGNLANVNGTVFFTSGSQIWRSDGTEFGTRLVRDIGGTSPYGLVGVNGALYFTRKGQDVVQFLVKESRYELWKSDGTTRGTVLIEEFAGYLSQFVNVNGTLFFFAKPVHEAYDYLWKIVPKRNASGSLHLSNPGKLFIKEGLTPNDFEQDGGELDAAEASVFIGQNHDAKYNISGGTAVVNEMLVGVTPGMIGTFTQSGGTVAVLSNLVVGDCASDVNGIVTLSGSGTLNVTNAAHSAVLDVRQGTLTLNGGATLRVDKLILTNSCGHFVKNGGTLIYNQLILEPDGDADGDGLSNGFEQAHGLDPLAPTANYIVTNNNDSGPGSLRAAVGSANVSTNTIITFSPNVNGTITLTSGELPVALAPVPGNSLSIIGPGAKIVGISGNNAGRVFNVSTGHVTITGLTLSGGAGADEPGGAIDNQSTLILAECTFSGNASTGPGGAIANWGALLIDRCTFSGNSSGSAAGGGAIINFAGGILTVSSSTFYGNIASSPNGGAGAIFNANDSPFLFGALYLTNCTLSGNISSNIAGAIYSPLHATMANTIIAGNTSGSFAPDFSGTVTSAGYNLIGKTDGSAGWVTSDLKGTIASPLNPQLGPLQDNGGPTWTMALLPGSPAIDHGRSFGVAKDQRGPARPFDFLMLANASGGDGSDIGAFEASALDDTDGDGLPNSWEQGHGLNPLSASGVNGASGDLDGDGQSNLNEFLAGTDSTDPASVFRITAFAREGANARVTWTTAPDRAYVLQRAPFSAGLFRTNFQFVGPVIRWTASGEGVTNYLVPGGSVGVSSAYQVECIPPPVAADDDASQAAYRSAWRNGQNGGQGFGPWVLTTSGPGSGGFFIGDSSRNGSGSSGNINTGLTNSWGLRASEGKASEAIRPFNLPLAVGSTLSVDMDNGSVNLAGDNPGGFGPGRLGLSLRSGNTVRFEIFYVGTDLYYSLNDAAGPHSSGIPFTDGGLRLVLTVTGTGDRYSVTITPNAGAPASFSGLLANSGSVDNIRFFDKTAGSTPSRELYFNRLQIAP